MSKDAKTTQLQIQSKYQLIWEWLTSLYEIKRDAITKEILFKTTKDKNFSVLEDENIDSLIVLADIDGLKNLTGQKIVTTINHFAPKINFIKDYFDSVKSLQGNAIEKLCSCIKTSNDNLFKKYFTKWLVASVANIYIEDNQNQMCLVLTGGQGAGKSTFFKYLCPLLLRKYFYSGDIDLQNTKDTFLKVAKYWIIDIDEQIKSLNFKDATKMKSLISTNDVKQRVSFGKLESRHIRIGNFLASTNDEAFLFDPTGSRRFPSFKILFFDVKAYQKINIDNVWSEAYKIFNSKNFTYWVDENDRLELEENNKNYTYTSREHEILTKYLKPISNKEQATHALQTNVLMQFLEAETQLKNLSSHLVGKSLKILGFINDNLPVRKGDFAVKGWYIKLETSSNNIIMLQPYELKK